VTKIPDGHAAITAIDTEHGAVQSRAEEKAIVDTIHRGWHAGEATIAHPAPTAR
jgi:hypothetical protein